MRFFSNKCRSVLLRSYKIELNLLEINLFQIWLIACAQCFPSPSLWKTLRECCMNWRHRVALIEQWNKVNLVLTSKVLGFMYGPTFPELKIGKFLLK